MDKLKYNKPHKMDLIPIAIYLVSLLTLFVGYHFSLLGQRSLNKLIFVSNFRNTNGNLLYACSVKIKLHPICLDLIKSCFNSTILILFFPETFIPRKSAM